MAKDYKKEYDLYHSSTKAKKDRASRNKVRRAAVRSGAVKKGDGKDIDHINGNPRDNRKKNLRVTKRSTNRKKQ